MELDFAPTRCGRQPLQRRSHFTGPIHSSKAYGLTDSALCTFHALMNLALVVQTVTGRRAAAISVTTVKDPESSPQLHMPSAVSLSRMPPIDRSM